MRADELTTANAVGHTITWVNPFGETITATPRTVTISDYGTVHITYDGEHPYVGGIVGIDPGVEVKIL